MPKIPPEYTVRLLNAKKNYGVTHTGGTYTTVRKEVIQSPSILTSGSQTGVRGPKGVRDGFPRGPREDSEK